MADEPYSSSVVRSLAPTDPNFAERLKTGQGLAVLLADTLVNSPGAGSYAGLYSTGLALQFLSHLNAVLILLANGLDGEAWIIGRSMMELLIRFKWVHKRKSHAHWVILGTEQADRHRFSADKRSIRSKTAAIAAIDQRIAKALHTMPKNARFLHNKAGGALRRLPNVETMAKECGALKLYRGFFKWGSDHTHGSHRVLERFMTLDSQRNFTGKFTLTGNLNDLSFASHHILSIVVIFLHLLMKCGWPVDKSRYQSLGLKLSSLRPPQALLHIRGGSP
jgi:hypothetical protein